MFDSDRFFHFQALPLALWSLVCFKSIIQELSCVVSPSKHTVTHLASSLPSSLFIHPRTVSTELRRRQLSSIVLFKPTERCLHSITSPHFESKKKAIALRCQKASKLTNRVHRMLDSGACSDYLSLMWRPKFHSPQNDPLCLQWLLR